MILYNNLTRCSFLYRVNRFVAHCCIDGQDAVVHVKNTGRLAELLIPGATVYVTHSDNPARKTSYDLVAVENRGYVVNIDSQAPNRIVREWIQHGGWGEGVMDLRSEVTHGDSRFDFAFRRNGKQCYLEVKGVTLENGGICAFPDAPTLRGVKHLNGLARAAAEGCDAFVLFVIQMTDVQYLHPNDATDPAFGAALRAAAAAGVTVLAMDCHVTQDSMTLQKRVPVHL